MNERYKLIVSGKNIYKEVELTPEMQEVKMGTSSECNLRLRKDMFFERVELTLVNDGNGWSILCSDNLYISMENVQKIINKNLVHGDEFKIKYQESDTEIFDVSYMIDFDYKNKTYNLCIDISGKTVIKIGGMEGCDILLQNQYIGNDYIELQKINNELYVTDYNSRYGVNVNGYRISGKCKIDDYNFISIVDFSFYYCKGYLYCSEKNIITRLNCVVLNEQSTHFQYPTFNRNTRINYVIPEKNIEIQQPSPKPQKKRKNIIVSIIPSITMLILMVVLRGIMGSGGLFVLYSVCSMGIGVIMSIVSYKMDGSEYKKEKEKRDREYLNYIMKKEEEIIEARKYELYVRNSNTPSLKDDIVEVNDFGKRIFEKSKKDIDFLEVYLGKGTIEAIIPVKYNKQEFIDMEDQISMMPEEISKKYKYIDNAPIVSCFNKSNGVGIVGRKEQLIEIMKNITLDIAVSTLR